MSDGFDTMGGQGGQKKDQTAWHYGRNAEPLPELHVFSRLSELDAAYAAELARRRARQETLEREIVELAKQLAAPQFRLSCMLLQSVGKSDRRKEHFLQHLIAAYIG